MGVDGVDNKYEYNRTNAKKQGFIVGAYHYFRPNENSTKQFENFSKNVSLQKGDIPPVLDVERLGNRNVKQLREEILNWLQLAEKKYGVKPIVYTGRSFYNKYLKGYIDEYPLWISSFSGKHKLKRINWTFHQFTDKVRVKGIKTHVDGNDFNGNLNELKAICIK
jgi:GH25 family lysozyme M1 (1,4-beta-N-acetylmuramidase)